MKSTPNVEHTMKPSLIGILAILAFGYMLAKNLPDIVRYIGMSRM
jgi:hypothetical protein